MATPNKFHKALVLLMFLVCFFLPANSAFQSVKAETADVAGSATTVFAKVSKSVVVVEVLSPAGRTQGSGVVYHNNSGAKGELRLEHYWRPFSYVVTNAHVVKNANSVSGLQGGARYLADVEYVDDEFDLALLRVEVLLSESPPSNGAELKVVERVFAIGSPLGLENSISEGIIAGRREQNGVLLLQTTAPISRGSSGGGLFDAKGRFVGVTTFKLADGENVNFAVDAYRVREISTAETASVFLRLVAEVGHFSPDEKALINSKALVDWLLTRDKNDMKLSLKILRESGSYVHSSEAEAAQLLDKVEKEFTQILAGFLRDQGEKTAKEQNKAEIVVIVCTWLDHEGRPVIKDEPFELDYTKGTVNGHPANFTDAEVSWTFPLVMKGERVNGYYVLNRYTGSIRVNVTGISGPFFGQCSRAAERKF